MTAPTTRMFAMCLPGLAGIVRQQLDELPGVRTTDSGFDGRADLVLFEAARERRGDALALRTTEDVFIEVGRALRSEGDKSGVIANRIWRPQPVQRALSIWAEHTHPLAASMTFRVVARVLSEKAFRRTDLRHRLTDTIRLDRPRWELADPARLEVWACEHQAGRFVAGLRLTDASMRQHDGRTVERHGALRPTLAAAMVSLAGKPSGVLLDPCCGSGTILREARASGWNVRGSDIDPSAAAIAGRNVVDALIQAGDARRISLPDASVGACVSNLPFGRQYRVRGDMTMWLSAVLREIARVTRSGGYVVLLAPDIPHSTIPATLKPIGTLAVRLLGMNVKVERYQRA
jgi:23S rRNA G2445 N2-methylase RlmL